ncbi:hypothetical protein KVH15_33630 [Streptomyces olivaceus]|uniref:hypothetical protein n=1 Tax=Streptomyces olivaceus TaxID=47716 RepID=UPI001CCFDA10|nr:hypothetical protein [Streptomyces olivaceus]MBZ6085926.1 hypothetical protein [Streptomyces olivaceus]
MSALPGQRAAQRPLRAAKAAQAVLGRAATAREAMSSSLVVNIRGQWMRQTWTANGAQQTEPYELGQDREEK